MSFEHKLFQTLDRTWLRQSGNQFFWKDYRCCYFHYHAMDDKPVNVNRPFKQLRRFRILDGAEQIGVLASETWGPVRWEVEPSPEQLMKLRLVL